MPTGIARAAQPDIPQLVELMHAFYAESKYTLDRAWARTSFERLLGNESLGRAWIARDGGEAVGYVVLTFRHSMEHGALAGCIDDLFVRPGARRAGAGRALLDAVFDTCRALEVAALQVEVGAGNEAAGGLYRAFGFEPWKDDRRVLTARVAGGSMGPDERSPHAGEPPA